MLYLFKNLSFLVVAIQLIVSPIVLAQDKSILEEVYDCETIQDPIRKKRCIDREIQANTVGGNRHLDSNQIPGRITVIILRIISIVLNLMAMPIKNQKSCPSGYVMLASSIVGFITSITETIGFEATIGKLRHEYDFASENKDVMMMKVHDVFNKDNKKINKSVDTKELQKRAFEFLKKEQELLREFSIARIAAKLLKIILDTTALTLAILESTPVMSSVACVGTPPPPPDPATQAQSMGIITKLQNTLGRIRVQYALKGISSAIGLGGNALELKKQIEYQKIEDKFNKDKEKFNNIKVNEEEKKIEDSGSFIWPKIILDLIPSAHALSFDQFRILLSTSPGIAIFSGIALAIDSLELGFAINQKIETEKNIDSINKLQKRWEEQTKSSDVINVQDSATQKLDGPSTDLNGNYDKNGRCRNLINSQTGDNACFKMNIDFRNELPVDLHLDEIKGYADFAFQYPQHLDKLPLDKLKDLENRVKSLNKKIVQQYNENQKREGKAPYEVSDQLVERLIKESLNSPLFSNLSPKVKDEIKKIDNFEKKLVASVSPTKTISQPLSKTFDKITKDTESPVVEESYENVPRDTTWGSDKMKGQINRDPSKSIFQNISRRYLFKLRSLTP